MKKIIFVFVLVILIAAGYFLITKSKDAPVPVVTFATEEECERSTGGSCSYQMCDLVPEGKTFEEVCGKYPKGWVPAKVETPVSN